MLSSVDKCTRCGWSIASVLLAARRGSPHPIGRPRFFILLRRLNSCDQNGSLAECVTFRLCPGQKKNEIIASVDAESKAALYRLLPSVDELLHHRDLEDLSRSESQAVITEAARVVLAQLREEIGAGRLQDEKHLYLALT